jgi:hypothetical protein
MDKYAWIELPSGIVIPVRIPDDAHTLTPVDADAPDDAHVGVYL